MANDTVHVVTVTLDTGDQHRFEVTAEVAESAADGFPLIDPDARFVTFHHATGGWCAFPIGRVESVEILPGGSD